MLPILERLIFWQKLDFLTSIALNSYFNSEDARLPGSQIGY